LGAPAVKVTVDTNVLVRAVVRDHKQQAEAAAQLLKAAELIAVPLPCLCEFVWVLLSVYDVERTQIAAAIRTLLETGNVVLNRPAVEAGLAFFEAGGDFADGLIAYEGEWLGCATFASFDKRAVSLLAAQGKSTLLMR
jgi:predicted nucleic-acid-binding protein